MNNNIFLTGTNGFIGKNIKNYLKIQKYKISCIDFNDEIKPFEFLENFNRLVKEGDVVIHNGACSSTTVDDPFKVNMLNFDYSQKLLKKCIEKKARLIYASSASVYGDGPFIEDAIKKPKNLYALSKSMFDDYSMQFKNFIPQIVGLRYFNVYGPHENHKKDMASVVYKFFHQKKQNNTIKLFKNSDQYNRDFVFIYDVVDMIMFFINNEEYSGIYNCGSGIANSFQDIANIFVKKYNCNIEYVDMPSKLKGKYQKYTLSNNIKINNIFSKNRTTLLSGVTKYIDYLELKNENIY